MRVITGRYKGRIIKTTEDLSVRPATDRVKQALFNVLINRMELHGTRVLDLFAGSGSLGIESLSRSAEHVTFVDISEKAIDCMEQNVRILGCESQVEILQMDGMNYLTRSNASFDIIFADPPYKFKQTREIPEIVFRRKLMKPRGYLVVEHATDVRFETTALYHVALEKKFGRTIVTFFYGLS
jgi:16S rRNA (guanine(966)-N(2))-methyltransferase RsmD